MNERDKRSIPISPEAVERLFNAATIKRLAELAAIPDEADQDLFGRGIRRAVRIYIEDSTAPSAKELRAAFEGLRKIVRNALKSKTDKELWLVGPMLALFNQGPPEIREKLDDYVFPHIIPSAEELMDPDHGYEALKRLYGLLSKGAKLKPGQKRPGGKKSRDTLQGEAIGPPAEKGRPPDSAEFMLRCWIGIVYLQATGKSPPLRVARGHSKQIESPFGRLLSEVFSILGVKNVSAEEIIRRYSKEIK